MVPTLPAGIGDENTANQANQFMRAQPWYQQLLSSWGQNPNAVHLSDQQTQQLLATARQKGIGISNDYEIDPSGNINRVGHKMRNTLIAAGIAGAALTGGASLGLLGGGEAGALASTATGTGMLGGITGGAGLAGAGAGAAGAGTLASTAIGTGMLGGIAGGAGLAGAAAGGAGGAGILGTAGSLLSGGKGAAGYLATAGKVASALGDAGKGAAASRVTEAGVNQAQDRNANDLYRSQVQANQNQNQYGLDAAKFGIDKSTADLAQRNYTLAAPTKRAGNAVRGDILSSAQDVSFGPTKPGMPTFTGGLRPSMFSDSTRQLGRSMTSDALSQQLAGDNFDPLPNAPAYSPNPPPPGQTPLPQAGVMSGILNTAGTVGNLAGLLSSIPYKRAGGNGTAYDPNDQNGWG